MKNIIVLGCLMLVSMTVSANTTTFNSDGSYSQTLDDGYGGGTTFNSDGSYSHTMNNGSGSSTTFNSDGSYSQTMSS